MLDTEMTHRQPGLRTPPAEELSPPHTPPQKPVDLKDSEKVQHDPLFPNKEEDPVDLDIADDYVTRTLQREPALPPIKWKNILAEIQWVSFIVLTSTPILGVYGLFTTNLQAKTAAWAALYYLMTGLGITAGECWRVFTRANLRIFAQNRCLTMPPVSFFQVTIVCGHTALMSRPVRSSTSWPLWAPALFRAPSTGGLVATAPITATPTPISTLTARTLV